LVIDDNPSPLAAHFLLGPVADAREIATRVRIDDYTYLHAVAETTDGQLFAAARFIKAAGGCSAPAGKDQALALEHLGKMKLNLAERSRPDEPIKAKLLISHPNNSGLQMDQVTRNYIPADFMQTLDVTYNGQSVFRLESDIAISEDPSFNFSFHPSGPAGSGAIKAGVLDTSQPLSPQTGPAPAPAQMRAGRQLVSRALQLASPRGWVHLFNARFDLGRVAKHPAPPADPAAGLQAEGGLSLLVMGIGHQRG